MYTVHCGIYGSLQCTVTPFWENQVKIKFFINTDRVKN